MAQELGLHRLYVPDNSFVTEAERIAFKSKLRTFALCSVNDVIESHIPGLPGVFDHVMESFLSPSNTQDWWVECIALTGEAMEPVDDYSCRILDSVLKPRHIRVGGVLNRTVRFFSAAISVRHFVSRVSSLGREGVPQSTGAGSKVSEPTHTTATAGRFETQDVFYEYMQLDAELAQWRASVPREWKPGHARYTIARTDMSCLQTAAAFFTLVILLARLFLMNACMSVINRGEGTGKPGHA